jgi:hypothetical protein
MRLSRRPIRVGDCVRLADGRVGRVRAILKGAVRVRVRRTTSTRHQLVLARATTLRPVDCPAGWMSPPGYVRYLRVTLAKMRTRLARRRTSVKRTAGR